MAERLDQHRGFYADLVVGKAGSSDQRLKAAFARVPREDYVGLGPWKIFTTAGYIETPSDDPVWLYQDILIGLLPDRGINNGEPSLHARCLAAIDVQPGDEVVHVGAGSGYYTALLAELAGESGHVHALEIVPELAELAASNLRDCTNIRVSTRSGSAGELPKTDVIYVNAGATEPLDVWLDSLRDGGQLIFPLTPDQGFGGMLLVRRSGERFAARFTSFAQFIPCIGARNAETAAALSNAFRGGRMWDVRSLHRFTPPDETAWAAGRDWWLSTRSNNEGLH